MPKAKKNNSKHNLNSKKMMFVLAIYIIRALLTALLSNKPDVLQTAMEGLDKLIPVLMTWLGVQAAIDGTKAIAGLIKVKNGVKKAA